MVKNIKAFLASNYLLVFIIVLFLLISLKNPDYFTITGIKNVLGQASIIGIIAIGMNFIIISGGVDLSVGSTMAMSSVIVAMTYIYYSFPFYLSLLLGFTVSIIIGSLIATFILYLKLPPFIASLGMLMSISGAARYMAETNVYSGLPEWFNKIWTGEFLHIPLPIIIWILIATIAILIQRYTTFGRYNYAIGANYAAAKVSGVNITKFIYLFYIFSSVMAFMSGMLMTARLNSGQSLIGRGYEFLAITAVVTGGTSLFGGRGSVKGCVYGAILISIVYTGVSFVGLDTYFHDVFVGIILIAAVLLDRVTGPSLEKIR